LEFSASRKLPLVCGFWPWARGGALFSYGPDPNSHMTLAATYVAKILKGAKPSDLPVEQSTKFEFVINLKTAKAFGLTIPQSLLLRADEIIQ
jgi:putative ABC transport system substrate-binding protein